MFWGRFPQFPILPLAFEKKRKFWIRGERLGVEKQ